MPNRMDKVNALLFEEVGVELGRLSIGEALATVTAVETTSDLREAHVWISLLPDTDAGWEAVSEAKPQLQQHIAERLTMKRTPRLTLKRDRSGEHAQHIERLLRHTG